MNAEARVCPHCARRQPISRATKRGLVIAAGVLSAGALAFYAFVAVPFRRTNQINALHICTLQHALQIPTERIVQEIEKRAQTADSWQDAYRDEVIALHCDELVPTD
jgi:hypothetical protein